MRGSAQPSARRTASRHYAAIDASLEGGSVCIVDVSDRIAREAKVQSEREALVASSKPAASDFARIDLEVAPLSLRLHLV